MKKLIAALSFVFIVVLATHVRSATITNAVTTVAGTNYVGLSVRQLYRLYPDKTNLTAVQIARYDAGVVLTNRQKQLIREGNNVESSAAAEAAKLDPEGAIN